SGRGRRRRLRAGRLCTRGRGHRPGRGLRRRVGCGSRPRARLRAASRLRRERRGERERQEYGVKKFSHQFSALTLVRLTLVFLKPDSVAFDRLSTGFFLRAWSESGPAPDNKPAPRPSPSRKSNIGPSDSPPDARKSSVSGQRHPEKKSLTPEPVPNFIIHTDERTREKNLPARGRACARRGREHGHAAPLRAQGRTAQASTLAERLS